MSKSFDIRVPIELLTSPIPHAARTVWIAIKSFQGNSKYCRASLEKIGQRIATQSGTPMDKSRVSKYIKYLESEGWILNDGRFKLSCKIPHLKVDQKSTKEETPKLTRSQRKVDQKSTKVDQKSTRTENKHKNQNENQLYIDQKSDKSKRMKLPTVLDVAQFMLAYAKEKSFNLNTSDEAETFVDFYTSKDWKVGKVKMKDWKSAARNWLRRSVKENKNTNGVNPQLGSNYKLQTIQRDYVV